MKKLVVLCVILATLFATQFLGQAQASEAVSLTMIEQSYTLWSSDASVTHIVTALMKEEGATSPEGYCVVGMTTGMLESDVPTEFWLASWDAATEKLSTYAQDALQLQRTAATDSYSFYLEANPYQEANSVIFAMGTNVELTLDNGVRMTIVTTTIENRGIETDVCGIMTESEKLVLSSKDSFSLWGAAWSPEMGQITSLLGPLGSRIQVDVAVEKENIFRIGNLPREEGINMFLLPLPTYYRDGVAGVVQQESLVTLIEFTPPIEVSNPVGDSDDIISPAPVDDDDDDDFQPSPVDDDDDSDFELPILSDFDLLDDVIPIVNYVLSPIVTIDPNSFGDDFSLYIDVLCDLLHLEVNDPLAIVDNINLGLLDLIPSVGTGNNTSIVADVNSNIVDLGAVVDVNNLSLLGNGDGALVGLNIGVNADINLLNSNLLDANLALNDGSLTLDASLGDLDLNNILDVEVDLQNILPLNSDSSTQICVLLICID